MTQYNWPVVSGGGGGGIVGPVSSTDNAVARWSGTGGDTLANSSVTIDGYGTLTTAGQIGASVNVIASSGSSLDINWNNANIQRITLDANCAITFSNPVAGFSYLLILVQDSGGSKLVSSWPTIKWRGGTPPTLSTAGNAIDMISLVYDGTNYYGGAALAFS